MSDNEVTKYKPTEVSVTPILKASRRVESKDIGLFGSPAIRHAVRLDGLFGAECGIVGQELTDEVVDYLTTTSLLRARKLIFSGVLAALHEITSDQACSWETREKVNALRGSIMNGKV